VKLVCYWNDTSVFFICLIYHLNLFFFNTEPDGCLLFIFKIRWQNNQIGASAQYGESVNVFTTLFLCYYTSVFCLQILAPTFTSPLLLPVKEFPCHLVMIISMYIRNFWLKIVIHYNENIYKYSVCLVLNFNTKRAKICK